MPPVPLAERSTWWADISMWPLRPGLTSCHLHCHKAARHDSSPLHRNMKYRIALHDAARIRALRPIGPIDGDAFDVRRVAQSEMDARVACRQVTRVGVNVPPKFGQTLRLHGDASADSKTWTIDLNCQPVATRQMVAQNSHRAVVGCDQNIDRPVVVDVAERGAATHSRLRENSAGFIADIRETALAARIANQ